jgi:hypothetical protein
MPRIGSIAVSLTVPDRSSNRHALRAPVLDPGRRAVGPAARRGPPNPRRRTARQKARPGKPTAADRRAAPARTVVLPKTSTYVQAAVQIA